jgi:hypothetical protein
MVHIRQDSTQERGERPSAFLPPASRALTWEGEAKGPPLIRVVERLDAVGIASHEESTVNPDGKREHPLKSSTIRSPRCAFPATRSDNPSRRPGPAASARDHLPGRNLRWAIKEIHQHSQAVLVVHVDDRAKETAERAVRDVDALADREGAGRAHDFAAGLVRPEFLNEAFGDERRLPAEAHQRADAGRRQDRPPARRLRAYMDEQVAGEQGSQGVMRTARVPDAPAHHRAPSRERLPRQVLKRDALAMRLRVDCRPPAR